MSGQVPMGSVRNLISRKKCDSISLHETFRLPGSGFKVL